MPQLQHGLLQNTDGAAALVEHASLHVRYSAGEMICQTGSYVAGIHVIQRGAVANRVATLRSGASRSCILGPGDLIGLEVLLQHGDRVAASQVRALTDVELQFLATGELHAALSDDAAIAHAVMERLAAQYFRMQQLLDASTSDEDALLHLLLQLAAACGRTATTGRVVLPRSVDRAALCELSGLSPRRLRRVLDDVASLRIDNADVSFDPEDVRRRWQSSSDRTSAARASLP